MNKQEIISSLKVLDFEFKDRVGFEDTQYYMEEIGIFKVYIYLSYKVRIIVETRGTSSRYIFLSEKAFIYKDATLTDILTQFKRFKDACTAYTNAITPKCKYCDNVAEIKGYRERDGQTSSELVCLDCNSLTNEGIAWKLSQTK